MSAILAFDNPGRPVLRGIEHYWTVIRDLDAAGDWTAQDVYMRSNAAHRATVADYIRRLVSAGLAVETGRLSKGPGIAGAAPTYRLCGHRPMHAPRLRRDGTAAGQGRGQQQMWNVMRGPLARDGFTFHDLALWGSTDRIRVTKETARKYIQHLAGAGYLLQLQAGRPGKAAVWRLKPAMNTGPRPPLILSARIVFDHPRAACARAAGAPLSHRLQHVQCADRAPPRPDRKRRRAALPASAGQA